MTSAAAVERTLFCATAQQYGADAPTLCGDWTVRDLVVHLLVRESGPSAAGILVPPLAGLTARKTSSYDDVEFPELVRRLRHGPPRLSPFSVPGAEALINAHEFFVHHEDIRRAGADWQPRRLPAGLDDALWRGLLVIGRACVRRSPVGVVAERSDTGARRTLKGGAGVTLVGSPSEIMLYVFGRTTTCVVEVRGEAAAVAALAEAPLGL